MLTTRETDVLRLLSGGCTYKTISAQLGISLHTVGTHIKSAYRKLDVHTGAAAVMRGVQLGLLGQDSLTHLKETVMKRTTLCAALAIALPAAALSGCYVVPVGPDALAKLNTLLEQAQNSNTGAPQASNASKPSAAQGASAPSAAAQMPAVPTAIQARLYPLNEIATENGMVSGTVTNMMNGKGRLQLSYRGELLTGEATRVVGDERKGIASAWGPNGSFMSCEYQMSSPLHGAGTCNFSDGARYQVHVGN